MRQQLLVLVLLIVTSGCGNSEKLQALQRRVDELERQAGVQKQEAQHSVNVLTQEKHALEEQVRSLQLQLSTATSDLASATQLLTNVRTREAQRREAATKAQEDEQRRRAEMLEQTRLANRPEGYPFRAFDAMYVGLQERNGRKATFGRFSVRNYTDQPLVGTASADETIELRIPPNTVSEGIFLRARRDQRVRIRSNLGDRDIEWEVK